MTRDEIIGMAREAGFGFMTEKPKSATHMQCGIDDLERFAELVAAVERNKVAQWMIDHSFATGHGDTTEDLLEELDWQITESWSKVVMASVKAEREACAQMVEELNEIGHSYGLENSIRARGQA